MRIYVATSPDKHFASVIPDAVRAAADVQDICWSTNATRGADGKEDPALWVAAAREADWQNLPFVGDFELHATDLATFLNDRKTFDANLALRVAMLAAVHAACPDVRVGVYPDNPPTVGVDGAKPADRIEHLRICREAVRPLCDFFVVEAYLQDLGKPWASLQRWNDDLDTALSERPDALTETYVLTSGYYVDGPHANKFAGPVVQAAMLATAATKGKVMGWNPQADELPVIQLLSRK